MAAFVFKSNNTFKLLFTEYALSFSQHWRKLKLRTGTCNMNEGLLRIKMYLNVWLYMTPPILTRKTINGYVMINY